MYTSPVQITTTVFPDELLAEIKLLRTIRVLTNNSKLDNIIKLLQDLERTARVTLKKVDEFNKYNKQMNLNPPMYNYRGDTSNNNIARYYKK